MMGTFLNDDVERVRRCKLPAIDACLNGGIYREGGKYIHTYT